ILVAIGLPSNRVDRVSPTAAERASDGATRTTRLAPASAPATLVPSEPTPQEAALPPGPAVAKPRERAAVAAVESRALTTSGTRPPLAAAVSEPKPTADVSRAMRSAAAMADLRLYDQALETLQSAVRANATSPFAPAAHLLMASIQERRGKSEDAIAMY